MSTGAAVVAGAGLLVAVVWIGIAYAQRDADAGDIDPSPREFFGFVGLMFGGFAGIVCLAAIVGAVVWEVTPKMVGIHGPLIENMTLGVVAGPVLYGLHRGVIKLLKILGFTFTKLWENLTPDTAGEFGWYVAGYGIQASAEEVIFRGALVGALSVALSVSAWKMVFLAAILFGLGHVGRGTGSVVSITVMGLGYGVVFLLGGLIAAALAHVLNNVTAIVRAGLFTSDETATQSPRPDEST